MLEEGCERKESRNKHLKYLGFNNWKDGVVFTQKRKVGEKASLGG